MASLFVYFVGAVGICVLILRVTAPTYIDESDLDLIEVPEWVNFPASLEQLELNGILREIIDSQLYVNGFRGKKLNELSDHLLTSSIMYGRGCVRLAEKEQH